MAEKEQRDYRFEIAIGVLLSLSGAATSWSGYQSALWGGVESESYHRATTLHLESSLAEAEAMQMRMIDGNMFTHWISAYAQGNKKLEEFYHRRFRPEFKPAFDAWIASDPENNPAALPTPLAQPEYGSELTQKSVALGEKAADTFSYAIEANTHSDKYLMTTVIFGLVMFFAGMAQQFEKYWVKIGMIAVSVSLISAGFYTLLIYPLSP